MKDAFIVNHNTAQMSFLDCPVLLKALLKVLG